MSNVTAVVTQCLENKVFIVLLSLTKVSFVETMQLLIRTELHPSDTFLVSQHCIINLHGIFAYYHFKRISRL